MTQSTHKIPSSEHSSCGRRLKTCHRHVFLTPRRPTDGCGIGGGGGGYAGRRGRRPLRCILNPVRECRGRVPGPRAHTGCAPTGWGRRKKRAAKRRPYNVSISTDRNWDNPPCRRSRHPPFTGGQVTSLPGGAGHLPWKGRLLRAANGRPAQTRRIISHRTSRCTG